MAPPLLHSLIAVPITLALAATARAEDRAPQGEAHPTPVWAAVQLIPSPGAMISRGQTSFTLDWQLTPLLWAFGQRPSGRRRVRSFIAEPMVRYGGSIELYYAPEYIGLDTPAASRWAMRAGVRMYLPVVQRGENFAVSLGVSDLVFHAQQSVVLDAGAYVLYGVVGLSVGWSPAVLGAPAYFIGLRVRYL